MVQSFSERRINNYLRLLLRASFIRRRNVPWRNLVPPRYSSFAFISTEPHDPLTEGNRFLLPSLILFPRLRPTVLPLVSQLVYIVPFVVVLRFCSSTRVVHDELRHARGRFRLLSRGLFVSLSILPSLFYGNPKRLGLELRNRRKMSLECAHDSLSLSLTLCPAVMLAK